MGKVVNLWTEDLLEETTKERLERQEAHVPVELGGSRFDNIALPKY